MIGQYTDGATYTYSTTSGRVFRVDYANDKAYNYGGDGTTKVLEDLDDYTKPYLNTVSSSTNPFTTTPNIYGIPGCCL